MDKLRMQTLDGVQNNIDKIAMLFPNCITERKDAKGKVSLAIDFDKLRQELSSEIVEGREERYQFTWPDKKKAVLLANSPINATLRPCREESVDFDNTQNLYIEGDNLDVLKCLKETYLGKVKIIYIDPPYNTGNDFVYEDNFAESTADYLANSGQFICMGCMGFGDAARGQHSWTLDEEHTREIIKRGLELGINFFDTAIAYQSGTSEQFLGRALRNYGKREDFVVATKFLPRTKEDIEAGISGQKHIEKMIDKSLDNLGMDYVDLYIYHMWDYKTPLYEIMDGLNRIVKAGKARYIGISNCFAWQLCMANELAEREGFAKFVSVQGHYNLIFREEEREMVPYCREENIALTPYSALAGGRLSKRPGERSKRLEEDSYAKLI